MLDAYIIDAIRQEELKREQEFERRRIHLELPLPMPPRREREPVMEDPSSGPIIIPFGDVEDAA